MTALHSNKGEQQIISGNLELAEEVSEQESGQVAILNQKIADYESQIAELNQVKKKLYSILSHDLRSPFNGLLGFTNFLANEVDEFSKEEIKSFANNINSAAKSLLELIDNIHNWAKLENGNTPCKPIDVELNYIVEEVFYLLKEFARNKNIQLINNIPPESFVYADLYMTKTMVQNLVHNAIKYSNHGGCITVNIIEEQDGFSEISVIDEGIGIQDCNKEHLFKIGSQLTTRGTENERGTGLGLIISKVMADLNKGNIKVKSEWGKGSTFYITLPRGKENPSRSELVLE